MSTEDPSPPQELRTEVNKPAVIIVCVIVFVAMVGIVTGLVVLKPVAEKVAPARVAPGVEVMTAQQSTIVVTVDSQGTVIARTTSDVASEVAGRVTWVAESFERGGKFAEGDELLKIEPANYEAALAQAQAELEEARLSHQLEEARATQAERDWQKLGSGSPPSDLVLRKPQLASAAARVTAAEAAVTKAHRDREQTVIRAPYDGRVRTTATDLGSYVTTGSPLAQIYATDGFEVALPLSLDDFAFLDPPDGGGPVKVALRRPGADEVWDAEIDRIEGEVDAGTRSVTVIAKIAEAEPFALGTGSLLGPGLFVEAAISGKSLEGVIALPREAMYDPDTVLTVTDGRLHFQDVTVIRAETERVLVSTDPADEGLRGGERVILTTLSAPIEGMDVQIVNPGSAAPPETDGAGGEVVVEP